MIIYDPETFTPVYIPGIGSVIVVGPDRVGKTTIVSLLSKIFGIPSFKCPTEKQIFKDGGRSSLVFDYNLTHFLKQTNYLFISDRGYPCEWVYSRVFKRETDRPLLAMIDANHAMLGTQILYLYSSVPPIEEDDLVPAEKYWDVKNTYDEFAKATSCKVIAYDTAKMLKAYQEGGDISNEVADEIAELLIDVREEVLP